MLDSTLSDLILEPVLRQGPMNSVSSAVWSVRTCVTHFSRDRSLVFLDIVDQVRELYGLKSDRSIFWEIIIFSKMDSK